MNPSRSPGCPGFALRLALLLLLSVNSTGAAAHRLNRSPDSAALITADNPISAAQDGHGNLHLVYTDSDPNGRKQVYCRSLRQGYLDIPVNLTGSSAAITGASSGQIVYEPESGNLYVAWISRSPASGGYRLAVEQINAADDTHAPVKVFDFGATNFPPKVIAASGKVFFLSQERLTPRGADFFRVRVFLIRTGEWTEKRIETTATEVVGYPTITASKNGALLFWVQSTSNGHDVMVARMAADQTQWSEAKLVFRSPALPEYLNAAAQDNTAILGWTLRGGAGNSILLQTVSRDSGNTWKAPAVLYSIGANAIVAMQALSEKEMVALLYISDPNGDKIKMKYTVNGAESWVPEREIDAIDIGPRKGAIEARRPSLVIGNNKRLVVAWEERLTNDFLLVFKEGALQDFNASPSRALTVNETPTRYLYFPQLWSAGQKIYFTYGNKRRPVSVTEFIPKTDLYLAELSTARAPQRSKPAAGKPRAIKNK
ncbi:MAG TPA: hypothetical protein VGL91_02310 [Acidobacteriota bacterium]